MKISLNKKYQNLIIPIIVVFVTALVLLTNHLINSRSPGDLGSSFEYIGKYSYGCFLVCDGEPRDIYFFATDLSKDQIIRSVKGAKYLDPLSNSMGAIGRTSDYNYEVLSFSSSARDFDIVYYDKLNSAAVRNVYKLGDSRLPFTIEIVNSHFPYVQNALHR